MSFTYIPGLLYVRESCDPGEPISRMELQFDVEGDPFHPMDTLHSVYGYDQPTEWHTEPRLGSSIECMKGAMGVTGSGRLVGRRRATDEDLRLMTRSWQYKHATFNAWLISNGPHLRIQGLRESEVQRLFL